MTSVILQDKISQKLLKICPQLRLDGVDSPILSMCTEDLINYFYWLKRHGKYVKDEDKKMAHFFEAYYIGSFEAICTMQAFWNYNIQEFEEEIEKFIELFVKNWWRKYKQRVKLVLEKKPPKTYEKAMNNGWAIWSKHFNYNEQKEIMEKLIDVLIQHGEICGARIIARQTLFRYLSKAKNKKWTLEDKLRICSIVSHELKRMAYTHGYLIFIRPNKKAMLREWRDDSSGALSKM